MVDISVEKYTNAKVCTIRVSNKNLFWVKMYDVQEGMVVKNILFRTKNPAKDQIRKYKRREKELDHNSTATFMYVHSDLMSKIIKHFRGGKKRQIKKKDFRCKLGFKLHDIIMCKEESVTIKIIKVFSNEKILLQHSVLNYQIDLYFSKPKLAIEVDEKGHTGRDENKKKMIEKKKKK